MEGDTTNTEKDRKYFIEVTQEDYELALATRVIKKSYKIVLGVLILIVGVLAFFGIKYNLEIDNAEKELNKSKEDFKKSELKFQGIADSLTRKVKDFEAERSFTNEFYSRLSNSYSNSTQAIFTSFIKTTKENLKYLSKIEEDVSQKISTAQRKTDTILSDVTKARAELKNNKDNLDEFKAYSKKVEVQKNQIDSLINIFLNEAKYERKIIRIGETAYFSILKMNIGYERASWKSKRKISFSAEEEYLLKNIPKVYPSNGSLYELTLEGNYSDPSIILSIKKLNK